MGAQNLLKLGLMRSKRAVGSADRGDDWPDTPGAFPQRELHEGANQIPWLVWRQSIWRPNRRGAPVERSSAWALVSFSRSLFLRVRACPGAAHCSLAWGIFSLPSPFSPLFP